MSQMLRRCCLTALLMGWICSPVGHAQSIAENGEAVELKVIQQRVDQLRKSLQSNADLDESSKETITQLLDGATVDLQAAETRAAEAATFQAAADTAEQDHDAATAAIAEPPPETTPESFESESSATMQQRLVEAQAALAAAEKKAALAVSEPARRQSRILAMDEEQSKLEESLATTREQLATPPANSEDPLLTDSRTIRLQSQLLAGQAALDRLRKEKVAYAETATLLPLQRQLAEREAASQRGRIAKLQQALADVQQKQIKSLRDRVDAAATEASPGLAEMAETNLQLLDRYEAIASRSVEVRQKLADTAKTLEEVKIGENTTIERVQAVGLTDALALLLQRQKAQLNKLRVEYRPDSTLRAEIRELQLDTFRLEDQTAVSIDDDISGRQSTADNQRQDKEGTARQNLRALQSEILSKLIPTGSNLFLELVSLDTTQRQLQEVIDRHLEFIEENLLWTRNAPFVTASDPKAAITGFSWLFSPANWAEVPRAFLRKFTHAPISILLLLVLIGVMGAWRPRWRRMLKTQADIARRRNCIELEPTIRAAFVTILLSAPIPLLLAAVGWMASESRASSEFLASLGWGCYCAAAFVTPFVFLGQVCRASGLGVDHFGWSDRSCKALRHAGRDIATAGGPLVLVSEMLHFKSDNPITDAAVMDSLGRYVLLLLVLVFLIQVHIIHRPGRLGAASSGSSNRLYRHRKLIYSVSMLVPIAIAVLISLGYEYMTFAVMSHLLLTFVALVAILVLQSIATRALLVRRRRLTIEQFRQRHQSQGESELVETVGIDLSASEVDLGSVSKQVQQLVHLLTMSAVVISLGFIWNDLLPGLRMLDRVTLWSTGTTTLNPVTLRDLLFALLSISVTAYAVISLPAMIEMFFLQPLGPGARYAVSTIMRYLIGTVGLVFGLSFLSIPWSQLSWVLAAASVGLGFGLQEILANFVSGIILLLEQPIRVGDVVTVDGSTGVVSKMQIRATTVTNWDRQELVIPNKDLVTGKLLNWTLSNVMTRITINVGVAYGSDANQVRAILMGVVKNHSDVLDDPPPLVTFEQFGDSSLNFVIRCYLPSLEKRLATTHDLHTAIAEALQSAQIEIPFPQRDIHMTIEPSGAVLGDTQRSLAKPTP